MVAAGGWWVVGEGVGNALNLKVWGTFRGLSRGAVRLNSKKSRSFVIGTGKDVARSKPRCGPAELKKNAKFCNLERSSAQFFLTGPYMNRSVPSIDSDSEEKLAEFVRLWSAAHSILAAYVHGAIRDRHLAEDVVQDIAEAAIRSFGDFDRERSFVGWTLGIARHRVLHHLRTKSRDRHCFGEKALIAIAEGHVAVGQDSLDFKDTLDHCVEKLSEKSRRLLAMRYENHHGLADISSQMNMTQNAVAVAIHRIRRTLLDCLRLQEEGAR